MSNNYEKSQNIEAKQKRTTSWNSNLTLPCEIYRELIRRRKVVSRTRQGFGELKIRSILGHFGDI